MNIDPMTLKEYDAKVRRFVEHFKGFTSYHAMETKNLTIVVCATKVVPRVATRCIFAILFIIFKTLAHIIAQLKRNGFLWRRRQIFVLLDIAFYKK